MQTTDRPVQASEAQDGPTTCGICGEELGANGGTVPFTAPDGASYEVDLCAAHKRGMARSLARFLHPAHQGQLRKSA